MFFETFSFFLKDVNDLSHALPSPPKIKFLKRGLESYNVALHLRMLIARSSTSLTTRVEAV